MAIITVLEVVVNGGHRVEDERGQDGIGRLVEVCTVVRRGILRKRRELDDAR